LFGLEILEVIGSQIFIQNFVLFHTAENLSNYIAWYFNTDHLTKERSFLELSFFPAILGTKTIANLKISFSKAEAEFTNKQELEIG
jgi:hypothetical protein